MTNNRLCIICNARKPAAAFETKGEHIVPRSLGNRKLRTPFVCGTCNGGLGGTVDVALKGVWGIIAACFDRDVGGIRSNPAHINTNRTSAGLISLNESPDVSNEQPLKNPDVKGAILKIIYEATHLRLGNTWLDDPAALIIRKILFAYVSKDRETARKLMDEVIIHEIPANQFYYSIGKPRSELIKRAIHVKSCLNGLWLVPIRTKEPPKQHLAAFYDIEGLPSGYVVVSDSNWDIDEAELLAPKLK